MNANPAPALLFPLPNAMNPREVFERNPVYTGHEEQFRLRPYEWEFYLWLDGRRTVQEIGEARKLAVEWTTATVERLRELDLIRVVEISLEDFYERFAGDHPAPPPVASAPPAPGSNGARLSASLRRGEPGLAARAAASRSALAPVPGPMVRTAPARVVEAVAPAAATPEFRLKPLLDFIISQAGGGTVGQLAAYRVFLKVPNELLVQSGIRSLNLVSADFVIQNHALATSLLAAVEEVLGKPYQPPVQAAVR